MKDLISLVRDFLEGALAGLFFVFVPLSVFLVIEYLSHNLPTLSFARGYMTTLVLVSVTLLLVSVWIKKKCVASETTDRLKDLTMLFVFFTVLVKIGS